MRVLDTSALLNWPPDKISGGLCALSQIKEIERLSSSKMMLLETLDIQWIEPTHEMLNHARECAAKSGDLAGLSNVDLDILSIALSEDETTLFTDDYRLQNVAAFFQLNVESVVVRKSKQVWAWHMKCKGCRTSSPVPQEFDLSKKGSTIECDRCGAQMELKRKN